MAPTCTFDLDRERAHFRLLRLLQRAHAGELAAALAYRGHARSLGVSAEADRVRTIEREELDHRASLRVMLAELGAEPDPDRERWLRRIGASIGLLCRIGGWFFPMYGAGRLEVENIAEYELASRLAVAAGYPQFAEPFLRMAEVEWEHERYFREAVSSHWLRHVLPPWQKPPPKDHIRGSFEDFRLMRQYVSARDRKHGSRRAALRMRSLAEAHPIAMLDRASMPVRRPAR